MFGLDDQIAAMSNGGSILDRPPRCRAARPAPRDRPGSHRRGHRRSSRPGARTPGRRAAALGVWWGLGHALTLVVFGVPILLFEAYLPERVQQRGRDGGCGADRVLAVGC